MQYIYCWWMELLSLFDLCCLKTWGVWISGMKEICICGMWLTVDVAIDDFNWYVVMLIFMMILIWDDVANEDHVNMNWCYYWWLCEYEMRLLLLLITSLRWDDIYVVNDMEIRFVDWCWKCIGMCMLCMAAKIVVFISTWIYFYLVLIVCFLGFVWLGRVFVRVRRWRNEKKMKGKGKSWDCSFGLWVLRLYIYNNHSLAHTY